jgi:hypothetical protein
MFHFKNSRSKVLFLILFSLLTRGVSAEIFLSENSISLLPTVNRGTDIGNEYNL